MKKLLFIIFLCIYHFSAIAQDIDYIKFKRNIDAKEYKLLTNKTYCVKLNPYINSNVLSSLDSTYNFNNGISLKLIGCNKDSLFFENGLGIPICIIESLDNIKQQTLWLSYAMAVNLSIIGIINYYTISKYHYFSTIVLPNIPFIFTGIAFWIAMPNKKSKFFINNYHVKEFRYYDREKNKIYSFGRKKPKTIFD